MSLPFAREIAKLSLTFATLLAVHNQGCDVRLHTGSIVKNAGRVEGLALSAGKRVILLWDEVNHDWIVLAVVQQ
jgi:hypothetical protein